MAFDSYFKQKTFLTGCFGGFFKLKEMCAYTCDGRISWKDRKTQLLKTKKQYQQCHIMPCSVAEGACTCQARQSGIKKGGGYGDAWWVIILLTFPRCVPTLVVKLATLHLWLCLSGEACWEDLLLPLNCHVAWWWWETNMSRDGGGGGVLIL